MPEYINIATREMPERERTWHWQPNDDYSESTGNRETIKYSGRWEEMLAMAETSGVAGTHYDVTATVTRQEGGMAELQIVRELFHSPDSGGDGDEDPNDDEALGSQDDPTYTCTTTQVQEPILAGKEYEGLSKLERRALKALMDGMDENSPLDDEDAKSGQRTIADCIKSDLAQKAYAFFARGVYYRLVPSTTVTARWTGGANSHHFGEIVKSTPGGFAAPGDRNFMCTGTSKERSGKKIVHTATFTLSGQGGWDGNLYK